MCIYYKYIKYMYILYFIQQKRRLHMVGQMNNYWMLCVEYNKQTCFKDFQQGKKHVPKTGIYTKINLSDE